MLNETNMNYQNVANIKILKQIIKRIWAHNKTVCASTPDIHMRNYNNTLPLLQQGVSLIIISPLLVHHSSITVRDSMGRWSWIQFNNRKGKNVIISVYAVLEKLTKPGVNTYFSQLSILQRKEDCNKSPCKLFWEDLTSYISNLHNDNTSLILGIDSNSDFNGDESNIKKKMISTGMVDVIQKSYPEQSNIPTFIPGKKIIDGILMSSLLCPSIINASHIDINDRIDTDDIGIMATLDKNCFVITLTHIPLKKDEQSPSQTQMT